MNRGYIEISTITQNVGFFRQRKNWTNGIPNDYVREHIVSMDSERPEYQNHFITTPSLSAYLFINLTVEIVVKDQVGICTWTLPE